MARRPKGRQVHGGAPEAPSSLHDPQYRNKKREEDRRLQEQYDQNCGPVTVRKIGDTEDGT